MLWYELDGRIERKDLKKSVYEKYEIYEKLIELRIRLNEIDAFFVRESHYLRRI